MISKVMVNKIQGDTQKTGMEHLESIGRPRWDGSLPVFTTEVDKRGGFTPAWHPWTSERRVDARTRKQ